jgi:hypothetical protein
MAIQLPELRQAVINYIDSKVAVELLSIVPGPGAGTAINPNDEFRFTVRVTNAAVGGIALTNLRYHISVTDRAKVRVPSAGTSRDAGGNPIAAGAMVSFFNFDPTDPNLSFLGIGEQQNQTFSGKIGASPGAVTLSARIEADPDINELFPRNETTPRISSVFSIQGV